MNSDSMKVFFPLEVFYPSQAGGPANSIYWLTKNLSNRGIQSTIVATDKGLDNSVPQNQWAETDYGKTIYITTRNLTFPIAHALEALKHFRDCDIVHVSSIFFPTSFLLSVVSRMFGKKLLLSPRGELDPMALAFSRAKKIPVLFLTKLLIGGYPTFHSTCLAETENIKSVFGEDVKIAEIPNYIEMPAPVKRHGTKYVLSIGRIDPKKALDRLINAVSVSRAFLDSGFVLKIAGTGKPKFVVELKKMVAELNLENKIEFLGHVEGPEKQKLYADAHFTVMPSHTENFGNVVLESLAQSTPVAASKGTPWSSLEDNKIGFWMDNSVPSLTATLEEMIGMDAETYAGYRRRAREFVKREFDIASNIEDWVQVYRNLL